MGTTRELDLVPGGGSSVRGRAAAEKSKVETSDEASPGKGLGRIDGVGATERREGGAGGEGRRSRASPRAKRRGGRRDASVASGSSDGSTRWTRRESAAATRAGWGGGSATGSGRASRRADASRDHTKVPRRREEACAGARSRSAPAAPPNAPAAETTPPRGLRPSRRAHSSAARVIASSQEHTRAIRVRHDPVPRATTTPHASRRQPSSAGAQRAACAAVSLQQRLFSLTETTNRADDSRRCCIRLLE